MLPYFVIWQPIRIINYPYIVMASFGKRKNVTKMKRVLNSNAGNFFYLS
jgi:hypothetical protein